MYREMGLLLSLLFMAAAFAHPCPEHPHTGDGAEVTETQPTAPIQRAPVKKARPALSRTRLPAFDVGGGFVLREGIMPGGVPIDAGIEVFRRGPLFARIGLGTSTFRDAWVIQNEGNGGWLWRQFQSTTLDGAAQFALVPQLRLEAVAGIGWHNWRQQWRQVQLVQMPFAGGGLQLILGPVGFRFRGTTDLRVTELFRSDGSRTLLSPVQGTFTFFYRYGGTRRMPESFR